MHIERHIIPLAEVGVSCLCQTPHFERNFHAVWRLSNRDRIPRRRWQQIYLSLRGCRRDFALSACVYTFGDFAMFLMSYRRRATSAPPMAGGIVGL